jgi:hypothetical protein
VHHDLAPLLELYERHEEGEAPFPPQFPKMEGEPLRSRPSVAGPAAAKRAERDAKQRAHGRRRPRPHPAPSGQGAVAEAGLAGVGRLDGGDAVGEGEERRGPQADEDAEALGVRRRRRSSWHRGQVRMLPAMESRPAICRTSLVRPMAWSLRLSTGGSPSGQGEELLCEGVRRQRGTARP